MYNTHTSSYAKKRKSFRLSITITLTKQPPLKCSKKRVWGWTSYGLTRCTCVFPENNSNSPTSADMLKTGTFLQKITSRKMERKQRDVFKSRMHSVPDISRVPWNNHCHCHVIFRCELFKSNITVNPFLISYDWIILCCRTRNVGQRLISASPIPPVWCWKIECRFSHNLTKNKCDSVSAKIWCSSKFSAFAKILREAERLPQNSLNFRKANKLIALVINLSIFNMTPQLSWCTPNGESIFHPVRPHKN